MVEFIVMKPLKTYENPKPSSLNKVGLYFGIFSSLNGILVSIMCITLTKGELLWIGVIMGTIFIIGAFSSIYALMKREVSKDVG